MPYHIGEKGSHDCSGFPVVKTSDGKVMGCHKTEADAKKQLAALYANEPEAEKNTLQSDNITEQVKEKSMALDMASAYASIIKQEKMEDGSLLVYGKATDDAVDIDQQICDAGWLNKAMPEWFKTGGNIREQHSSIAAGVAKELDSKEDGHYITAHIVDPVSVKKIEAGVLKGFSIGIRGPRIVRDNKAANGRIIDGTIVEISVVDRPANPNAKLMLAKSDGTEMIEVEQELVEQELPETEETVETPVVEEAPVAEVAAEVEAGEDVVPALDEEKEDEIIEEVEAEKVTAIFDKAKSLAGDVNKFDKKLFENARTALAGLIAVEAKEMGEGHDERFSLNMLVNAVHALFAWYEGEEMEGEVKEEIEMAETEGSEKQSTITPLPTIERVGDVQDEDIYEDSEDNTDKSVMSDDVVNAILEKAVKSAKESVSAEINSYKDEINALKGELATALNKAVAGGPKRSATKPSANTEVNELVVRALELRTKAASTTDRDLAKGYRELADDFEAKAKELTTK